MRELQDKDFKLSLGFVISGHQYNIRILQDGIIKPHGNKMSRL